MSKFNVTTFRSVENGVEHVHFNFYENGIFKGNVQNVEDPDRLVEILKTGGANVLSFLEHEQPIEPTAVQETDV